MVDLGGDWERQLPNHVRDKLRERQKEEIFNANAESKPARVVTGDSFSSALHSEWIGGHCLRLRLRLSLRAAYLCYYVCVTLDDGRQR